MISVTVIGVDQEGTRAVLMVWDVRDDATGETQQAPQIVAARSDSVTITANDCEPKDDDERILIEEDYEPLYTHDLICPLLLIAPQIVERGRSPPL